MSGDERGVEQSKQDRLGQPLEVDGGGGEQGLYVHVFEAASGGSGNSVEGFGQPVRALDPPAVAGIEAGFGLTPGQSLAPVACASRLRQSRSTST